MRSGLESSWPRVLGAADRSPQDPMAAVFGDRDQRGGRRPGEAALPVMAGPPPTGMRCYGPNFTRKESVPPGLVSGLTPPLKSTEV